MLKQPPAAPPGIEPNGPIGGDATIARANSKTRSTRRSTACATPNRTTPRTYPNYYDSYYSPFYYPSVYYYPLYRNHNHHHYPHVTPHSGFSVSGSYTGNHVNANFSFGGGGGHVRWHGIARARRQLRQLRPHDGQSGRR